MPYLRHPSVLAAMLLVWFIASSASAATTLTIATVNNRDMNAYLANQHPDVEFVLPGGTTLRGREQVRASTQAF